MKSTARFSVDPRLFALLGESYTSSERALRDLVDNAWDAEARVVKITLSMVHALRAGLPQLFADHHLDEPDPGVAVHLFGPQHVEHPCGKRLVNRPPRWAWERRV